MLAACGDYRDNLGQKGFPPGSLNTGCAGPIACLPPLQVECQHGKSLKVYEELGRALKQASLPALITLAAQAALSTGAQQPPVAPHAATPAVPQATATPAGKEQPAAGASRGTAPGWQQPAPQKQHPLPLLPWLLQSAPLQQQPPQPRQQGVEEGEEVQGRMKPREGDVEELAAAIAHLRGALERQAQTDGQQWGGPSRPAGPA